MKKVLLLFTLLFISKLFVNGQVLRNPVDCELLYDVFERNGKYGVKNPESGKVTTRAKYSSISLCEAYNGKFGKAKKKRKWALIERNGKPVSRFKYREIKAVPEDYSETFLMASREAGNWMLIGSSGQPVSDKHYHEITRPRQAMFKVRHQALWGVIDTTGMELIPLNYDNVSYLSNNAYAVEKNGKQGIKFIGVGNDIPLAFESVGRVRKGFVAYKNGYYHQFNEEGLELGIEGIEWVSNYGNIYYDDEILVKKQGKYGLIRMDTGWVVPARYDSIQNYLDYHIVTLDGLFGIYGKNDNLILSAKYNDFRLSHKDFIVRMGDKMGVIGRDGNELIPVEYDQVMRLVNRRGHGLDYTYGVLLDNTWKLAHSNGEIVDSLHFSQLKQINNQVIVATKGEKKYIGEFDGEKFKFYHNFPLDECGSINLRTNLCTFRKDGKVGVIDLSRAYVDLPGFIVHPPEFDSIYYAGNHLHLVTEKDNKFGLMNRQGKIFLPCEYDEIESFTPNNVPSHHYLIIRNEKETLKVTANGKKIRMDNTNKLH